MTDNEVDFWSATIESYAPLELPSPQLTVKLLKRPPFRFIHDLISAINNKYNTFAHVFSADQLSSNNIDSKDAKIAYLNTVIQHVERVLHAKVDVSVKKIITGNEPEKTNVLLQHIAKAAHVAGIKNHEQRSSSATSSPRNVTSSTGKPPSVESPSDSPVLSRDTHTRSSSSKHSDRASTDKDSVQTSTRASSKRSHKAAASTGGGAKTKTDTGEALRRADAFNSKITKFAIGIDANDTRSVTEDGRRIAEMWNELASTTLETTPSKLSSSALEIAIKRQIESIKQVSELDRENDEVIQSIVDVLL